MPRAAVTHAVPGRLRVRMEDFTPAQRRAALAALEELAAAEGVSKVTTDSARGSGLVEFDPDRLDLESAVDLVKEAHEAFADVAPPGVARVVDKSASIVAGEIQQRFTAVDDEVRRATHGAVDLKMLVPLGLGALAIRQLVRTGPLVETMPWYMLAYYSFDTFVKLHAPQGSAGRTARG